MALEKITKVIVFVPETHADAVRQAMGDAGAGMIGNYHHCSYSTKGIGRFTPTEGAHPAIGEIGKPEEVIEERIETPVAEDKLDDVLRAILAVHPYEEPVIEVIHLLGVVNGLVKKSSSE